MIIERIHLHNFKSHEDTIIDFQTGITTMMGPNGAGKSSIFEGVSFALFKQYQSKRIDDLIRTGEKKMSVEVTFIVGGRTYRVLRERSKSSKALLEVKENDGFHPLVQGDTDVTNHVEDLLEMDGELFLNAVYVRQGEIADLIDKTPAEKKQMIGRLLGIDSLEKAWKQMKFIIEKYDDQALKLEGKLESFEDLQEEITTKETRKIEFEGKVTEVDGRLQETIIECKLSKEKKDLMDEKAKKVNELTSDKVYRESLLENEQGSRVKLEDELNLIRINESKIEKIKLQIKDLDVLKELKESINTLGDLQEQKTRIEKEQEKIKALQQTISDTKKDHDLLSELSGHQESDREALHEKRTELSNLRVKNQSLDKPIKELEEVKDSCPICKSSITEEKRNELLDEYGSEVLENREKIKILLDEVNELNNDLSALESRKESARINSEKYLSAKGALESLRSFDELKAESDNLQTQITALKTEINKVKVGVNLSDDIDIEISILERLKEEYNQLKGQVNRKDEVIKAIEKADTNIETVKGSLEVLINRIGELKYNKEGHDRINSEWEENTLKVNELTGQKHSLTGQLNQLSSNLQELGVKVTEFKKVESDLKRVKDFIKFLQFIRDVYGKDGVQKELRNISRPLIEAKTRELFEKFNFDYSDIQLDSEYSISIFGPAGESNLDMISGGEKIAVALALRLAITQVLSGNSLELIMLDEPTIHLDSYRRQELIELLKKMSILPQMIIVTHDNDLEEAADNILRIQKGGGDSTMVEVGGE